MLIGGPIASEIRAARHRRGGNRRGVGSLRAWREATRSRLHGDRTSHCPGVSSAAGGRDMAQDQYDAIVVGARCAGSPTAMLLAQKGYRVLVVDRATFPSETMSTHIVHPPGVAALERWGLLDRLTATGCPPIDTYTFDFGPFTLSGAPGTDDSPIAYCPRRTVLDKLLVDAASEAGAEVREEFTIQDVVTENDRVVGVRGHSKGGQPVTESARAVIGADGRNSFVARAVGPEQYNEKRQLRLLERLAHGRPLRGLHPSGTGMGGGADARRPDPRRGGLAVRGV